MSDELKVIVQEIEQLGLERDDFVEIASLPTVLAWNALCRKMDAEEAMKVQRLLVEKEPAEVRYIQGFLGALRQVRDCVADSVASASAREEEIAVLQQQKDDLLDQQE